MSEVADKLDVDFTPVITHLFNSVNMLIYEEGQKPENDRRRIGGKIVVNRFLSEVYACYGDRSGKALAAIGIESGTDVGRFIFVMCDLKLIMREVDDKASEFDGLFQAGALEAYMKNEGLLPVKRSDYYRSIAYAGYIIGFILVVGNYLQLVLYRIAWAGWFIGIAGWLLLTFRNRIERLFRK